MDVASTPSPARDGAGKPAAGDVAIDISGVSLRFDTRDGPVQALSNINLKVDARRIRLLHRPFRLRQDDAPARGRRSRDADQRRDPGQRHEPA